MKKIALTLGVILGFSGAQAFAIGTFIAKKDTSPTADLKVGDSPFPACKATGTISSSDYAKNKAYWDHIIKDCGENVQVLADTGFFNTILSKLGDNDEAQKSNDFLREVAAKADEDLSRNIVMNDILGHCAREDKAWFESKQKEEESQNNSAGAKFYSYKQCGDLMKAADNDIETKRPELRQDLALSRYEDMVTLNSEHANPVDNINKSMQSPFLLDAPKMDPLSDDELSAAVNTFNSDSVEVNQQAGSRGHDMRVVSMRGKKQLGYRAKYAQICADSLVVCDLDATTADLQDPVKRKAAIAAAADKKLKAAKDQLAELEGALKVANAQDISEGVSYDKSPEQQVKDLSSLMKYSIQANKVLTDNPKDCAIAASITNYLSHQNMKNQAPVMAGLMLLSGGAGAAADAVLAGTGFELIGSAAAGAVAAAPYSYSVWKSDINEISASKQRVRSGVANQDQVDEAVSALKMNLAMLPLGAALNGAAFGKAIAGTLRTQALKAMLRDKGVADEEINQLLKNAKSQDPVVASRAANDVLNKLEVDKDQEALLLKTMAGKGFLAKKPDEYRYLKILQSDLPKDEKERAIVVKRALEIFKQIDPNKFNEYTRERTIHAIEAAAAFGELDPKQIALKLSDWDQGIEGLTAVYKKAAEKMKTPEFLQISSVEERQSKALGQSIEELEQDNPEFAGMSAEEKAAAEKKMVCCARGNCS